MKMNYKKLIIIVISFILVIGLLIFLYLKNKEVTVTWDQSATNYITLKDNNSSVNGNGVSISNNTIYINYSGIYEISGTLTDGKIIVNIKDEGNVTLILNGVNITSSTLPLFIKNTKQTTITLKENTENYFTDSNAKRDEDGVIYSKDDLIINGTGTLNIKSNYADGLVSSDTLTIEEGTYIIETTDDGIKGRDCVLINTGNFTITSGGDAIKSTNDEDSSLGYIKILDGTFKITSEDDGLEAVTNINISNGTFDIVTGGGSSNSSSNSKGMWSNSESTGSKAIKGNNIVIENGTFDIDSSDDSIHSNNNLTIKDGIYTISSGDDGIHADTKILIENGTININKSYEGIESAIIEISDGNIHVISSDDGINIAGGNDSSSMNGRAGQNTINVDNGQYLKILSGYIYVDATGDGLDANGSIYINGGTIIVNGPTANDNGALDYDGECIVKNATLIAGGSSGMLQTPSTSSTIYTLSIIFDSETNGIIHIENEDGKDILTYKPSKYIKSLVFSSSLLVSGETYKIYIDGTYSTSAVDGIYSGGTYNGTLYKSVTISSKTTQIGTISNLRP